MPKKTNKHIARILREFAQMYEAEGVAFKPQAYQRAAKTVEELGEELRTLYKKCGTQCIDDLPGIGESIAKKIEALVTTGTLPAYDTLKKKYPFDILALTAIEGVGPKTALDLFTQLQVKTIEDVEEAARANRIAELSGYGKKTQQNILEGIRFLRKSRGRVLLSEGLRRAQQVIDAMQDAPGLKKIDVTGSVRRRKETIGDLDFIATSTNAKATIEAFKHLPFVEKVFEESEEKVFVRFAFGLDGDLLILKPEEYGSAMQHFTGGKEHNIQLRTLARKKGYTLSEFGLKKGKKVVAGKTEASIYKALGLQVMPPELREGRGEIEAAKKGTIPNLVAYGSIKGDLQIQTSSTDGQHSIEEMAEAAIEAGLEYIAITDHTQALAMTGGLDEKKLAKQGKEIDKLNAHYKQRTTNFSILKSAEINILKDGSLDIEDDALKTLDVVCVAVHSHFNMPEKQMTERIIAALKHPLVQILFHPTGRKLNQRPPYALDIAKVVRAAKQYGVALEANASPERLDLKDTHIQLAVEAGVKIVVNSDAHDKQDLAHLDLGVAQARRGWAKPSDVLNTKAREAFLKAVKN